MLAVVTGEYLLSLGICASEDIPLLVLDLIELSTLLDTNEHITLESNIHEVIYVKMNKHPHDNYFNDNPNFRDYGVYDAKTVARYLRNILSKYMTHSCYTILNKIIPVWDKQSAIVPEIEIVHQLNYEGRQQDLKDLLEKIGLYNLLNKYSITLLHYPQQNTLKLSGHLAEYLDNEGQHIISTQDIDQPIQISKCLKDVYLLSNPLDLYTDNATDIKLALKIGELQQRNQKKDITNSINFELGKSFVASLIEHQCCAKKKFSSTCFKTIVDSLVTRNGNIFRENSNSNAKQREQNEYKAYRVHITESSEALRLMFWMNNKKEVILANVGNKHEEYIAPI